MSKGNELESIKQVLTRIADTLDVMAKTTRMVEYRKGNLTKSQMHMLGFGYELEMYEA